MDMSTEEVDSANGPDDQSEEEQVPACTVIVDRKPEVPVAVALEPTSMSLQWNPVSVTVESTDVRVVDYALCYELQMQQVMKGW
jgi:hypothetical protein